MTRTMNRQFPTIVIGSGGAAAKTRVMMAAAKEKGWVWMEKEKGAVGSGVDFVRKAWRERKDTG